jgi:hypothetical protein
MQKMRLNKHRNTVNLFGCLRVKLKVFRRGTKIYIRYSFTSEDEIKQLAGREVPITAIYVKKDFVFNNEEAAIKDFESLDFFCYLYDFILEKKSRELLHLASKKGKLET